METDIGKCLDSWFIMLNTDEFDSTDAEVVREEIKRLILRSLEIRLGTKFDAQEKEGEQ